MVGSGLVGVGLGLVVTNLALVLHVGVVLCVLINVVVNNLGPAVRQQDLVLTCGSILGQSVNVSFKRLGIGALTFDCLSFPNFSFGVNVWVAIGVFLMNVVPIVVRGLLKRVWGSRHLNLLL